eukprot:353394-Chlamydomonas_euryale.AAC.11
MHAGRPRRLRESAAVISERICLGLDMAPMPELDCPGLQRLIPALRARGSTRPALPAHGSIRPSGNRKI